MSHFQLPWRAIINPAAARGRAKIQWMKWLPQLQAKLPQLEWAFSEEPGHATQLAKEWVGAGCRYLIAVGGDGTHHEVVNGLIQALGPERAKEVLYSLLPLGSGNDWIRTYGQKRGLTNWLQLLERGQPSKQNIGQIQYRDSNGQIASRYFANVAGMAYDAFVVRQSAKHPFKRKLLYPLLTLLLLHKFKPPHLRLEYDQEPALETQFYTINLGIGRYSGGGMRLVPQAEPAAERMALTYAKKLAIHRILLHSWRFYTGSIGQVKEVSCTHASAVKVSAPKDAQKLEIEADGEWLGYGPVEVVVLPQVLQFLKF
ncbi:MAG: diacylglycerol kinase family protein [Bacteroidota bacterium]